MRRAGLIVLAVGAVLLVGGIVWLAVAPGQLVKFPSDVNKTIVAKGTIAVSINPLTGQPLSPPERLPLLISRHFRVLRSSGSQAIVGEHSVEQLGPIALQLNQQYVIDRRSMRDVASANAWAYRPSDVVNRSPFYSINLPLDTGSGPYPIWKNEVGRPYEFRRVGTTVRDGVTLVELAGSLASAPAQRSYLDQLTPLGLPGRVTIAELAPELRAVGLDPAQFEARVLPRLSAGDRATVRADLAKPLPVHYLVSVDTHLLVEPTTGIIVSLQRIDQTLSAKPDFGGLAGLLGILTKPQYASDPVLGGTLSTLLGLAGRSFSAKLIEIDYGQTPASVADMASYASSKASDADLVQTTVPLVWLIVAALVTLAGAGLALRTRGSTTDRAGVDAPDEEPRGGAWPAAP